jgi:hypothetical protein
MKRNADIGFFTNPSNFFRHPFELVQDLMIQTIAGAGTFHFPFDQPGVLERFQMLAHRRLGKGKNLNNFTANTLIDGLEMADDLYPRRMAQRLADRGEGICIHGVFIPFVY